ncbi:DNA-directed RNA polymerase subunit omega [Bacillus andreraoultii]|uniref:DNA-directed RNA polymerase subunit omega n=1 Tax=Bacillus andreraoultii TaxID=1499685 RepID=UPI0005397457|nr:DNA-directed RNA polymerase subunit omega [Bacillus andreraoultii]
MLYPSIDSLLNKVHSKYLLVTIASKRARQLQDTNDYQLSEYQSNKNVGKALEEIHGDVLMLDGESENRVEE